MVDLTITAANVQWVGGVAPLTVIAGATITRGQALYKDAADNRYKLADADLDANSVFAGLALTDGVNGRHMLIAPPGAVVNVGATTVSGTIYVASTTAGGIAPWADLGSGDYVCVLFVGNGTAQVELIGKRGTAVI